MSGNDDAADLEALDPSPVEPPVAPRKVERRHPRFLLAGAVLVGVVVGSVVTVGIDRHSRSTHVLSPANPTPFPTGSVVPNPVTRLRQPTKLGSWTIVAQGFERRSSYCTKGPSGCHWLPAPTGHRWLITDISVTNTSGEPHTFDSRAVAAHYGGEALSAEVHAQWNTEESLSPNRTIPLELVFPVPVWSHIYTLVFRKDLEAEKHAGTAAEIDLNCC